MRISASVIVMGTAFLTSAMTISPAAAQSNPSAAQIISALTPMGTVSDTTRGIRPLSEGTSSAPAMAPMAGMAKPVSTKVVTASNEAPSTNLDIVFHSGSAMLTPSAAAELDQLGKALTSSTLASYRFQIIGHTDTTGQAPANQTLSQQRALTVATYLESKFGVPAERLTEEGVGEADLLIPTPPQTPELRNRRVEIVNLGAK
jgi:outer membrane protein OmpA-like peptidoglycan-associated protein